MYTIKDIAEMTGNCQEQVRRWIKNGKLKAERLNGKTGHSAAYIISESDFEEFINNHSKGTRNVAKHIYHQKINDDKLNIILEIARLETVIEQAKKEQTELLSKLKD